ncbi:hypothetical protein Tco_1025835 [Tanacetum coccineum]
MERLRQQYAPPKSIEDIREIKMEHARKQQVPKAIITSSDTTDLEEFNQKTTLFKILTKSKSFMMGIKLVLPVQSVSTASLISTVSYVVSTVGINIVLDLSNTTKPYIKLRSLRSVHWDQQFNKILKKIALYHALVESILEDKDVMDEGVSKKFKKRKPDDADKDKGPSARSDQGLKGRKATKTLNHLRRPRQDMDNINDQPNVKAALKHDWFKKPERSLTPDSNWNVRKSVDFRLPQTWISKIGQAEKPPHSFDELMSTPIDFSAYVMNNLKIYNLTQEHLVGPAFNLLKWTCRSRVEHEYNFEEYVETRRGVE